MEHDEDVFGWGCVINFQKKANQKVRTVWCMAQQSVIPSSQNAAETVYIAEVMLCCSSESCRNAPKAPPRPPPPGDKGEMQVLCHLKMYIVMKNATKPFE